MRITPSCASLLCALLLACSGSSPTQAAPLLLDDDLRPLLPIKVTVSTLNEPTLRVGTVTLPGGGVLLVRTTSTTSDEGGHFLLEVEIRVDDSDGWGMSAERSGEPVNLAAESGRAAQMAQNYQITSQRDAAVGVDTRETMIQVTWTSTQVI